MPSPTNDAYPPMPQQRVPERLTMVTKEGEQYATTNQ